MTLLYLGAPGLLAIAIFGLFGIPRDPLSSVFRLALGLPWKPFVDCVSEACWPAIAASAPAVNPLLALVCRVLRRRRGRSDRLTP